MHFNKIKRLRDRHGRNDNELFNIIREAQKFVVFAPDFLMAKPKSDLMGILDESSLEELSYIRPPYKKMYIEVHKNYNSEDGGTVDFGAYIEQDSRGFFQMIFIMFDSTYKEAYPDAYVAVIDTLSSDGFTFDIFSEVFGAPTMEDTVKGWEMWQDMINSKKGIKRFMPKKLSQYRSMLNHSTISMIIHTILKAFIFINSKSIGHTTYGPPSKIQKKRIKKKNLPLCRFKTLHIIKDKKGPRTKKGTWGQVHPMLSPDGSKASVIGHMAFYKKSAPLFGIHNDKRFYGNIWRDAYIRNKDSESEIVKTYKITKKD